jgi:RHS repeat-associated protein
MQDLNGDGIPDLIARIGSSFVVWYGKGSYEFEESPIILPIIDSLGQRTFRQIKEQFEFTDLNGDGIADLIIHGKTGFRPFLFDGKQFKEIDVPSLRYHAVEKLVPLARHNTPLFGDFLGTGNPQMTIVMMTSGATLELNRPGAGLLHSLNDGKGNQLVFTYQRAKASPGVVQRPVVLESMTIQSSGKAKQTTHYHFDQPQAHSEHQSFLGYNHVQTIEKYRIREVFFKHEDDQPSLLLSSVESDSRRPHIQKLLTNEYEDHSFKNILHSLKRKEVSGWKIHDKEVKRVKGFTTFDQNLCPTVTEEINGINTLLTQIDYQQFPKIGPHLTCFPQAVHIQGKGVAPISQKIDITRDNLGHELIISTPFNGGRTYQEIHYDTRYLADWVRVPGKGTTFFSYNNLGLPMSVIQPDGVVFAAQYSDHLLGEMTARIKNPHHVTPFAQYFSYDHFRRLSAKWNNLIPSSQNYPLERFTYEFGSETNVGWIQADQRFDATQIRTTIEYHSADGKTVASLLPSDQGWAVNNPAFVDPESEITQIYPNILLTQLPDSLAPDLGILKSDFTVLQDETSKVLKTSIVKTVRPTQATINQIILDFSSGSRSPQGESLSVNRIENESFLTSEEIDLSGLRTTWTDEEGKTYTYLNDALERLSQVILPGQQRHTVIRDLQGRVERIQRDQVGSIAYTYYPGTDLVSKKSFIDSNNKTYRTIDYTYDLAGRKLTQLEKQISEKTPLERLIQFFYDGNLPQGKNLPDQTGFLTAVTSSNWTKIDIYRGDGKLLERTIELLNQGKSVASSTLSLSYFADSEIAKKAMTYCYKNQCQSKDLNFFKDFLGRLRAMGTQSTPEIKLDYDILSQLEQVKVSGISGDLSRTYHHDPVSQFVTETSGVWNGNSYRFDTFLNDRALIAKESFSLADRNYHRNYNYTPNKSLSQEALSSNEKDIDANFSAQFKYDLNDLISLSPQNPTMADYKWDAAGRLIETDFARLNYGSSGRVEWLKNADPETVAYTYDEIGKRIAKWKGGQLAEAYFDDALIQVKSDQMKWSMPLKVENQLIGYLNQTGVHSVLTDFRGTLFTVDSTSGQLKVASAYGERKSHDPELSPLADFASQGYDADLKAYRMEMRDYSPLLKRFTTPDPLFFEELDKCVESPKECNLYGYAAGDPLRFVDPSGTTKISAGGSFSGWLGPVNVSFSGSFQMAWGQGKGISTGFGITTTTGASTGVSPFSVGGRVTVTDATEVKSGSSVINQTGGSVPIFPGTRVGMDKVTSWNADVKHEGVSLILNLGLDPEVHSRTGTSTSISTSDIFEKVGQMMGLTQTKSDILPSNVETLTK